MVDKTKKSDDLFFEIFYSNPIGMIISNLETTKFQFVNEIFLKSFGYKKAEVIGKTALDLKLIEPDFNKKILSQLQLQGCAEDIEVLGRKKTGETFWALASVKVITINDEKFAITSFINITARKSTIQEFKETEEKYKNIYQNSIVAMYTYDLISLKTIEANSFGIALFGYKSKKDFFENFDSSKHMVNASEIKNNILELKNIGEIKNRVHKMKKVDGSEIYVKIFSKTNLEKTLVQSVVIDITEQIISNNELIISEAMHRDIYQNSVVAMFTINFLSMKVVNANNLCVQLFGYKTIQDFNNNFGTKKHFADLIERKLFRKIIIKNGEIFRSIKMKKLDGTFIWVSLFAKLNTEKNIVQVMAVDISSQIKISEELKLNESKFKDLFENSLMPIYITDAKTKKPSYVNKIGAKLLGYNSIEDYFENHIPEIHFVNPKDQIKIQQDIINHGESKLNKLHLKKVNGTPFVVQAVIKLSSDKLSLHSTFIDITKQISSEQGLELKVKKRTLKLTESLIREKKLHDLATNFVTLASHEFRTPLATILSSASIIEMYPESHQQSQRAKHVKLIGSTIQNLTGILTDFLLIGELDNGSVKTKTSEIDLKKFITTVMIEMNSILKKKNQEFVYNHVGETKIIQSEKILRNILYNLISNASKYSPTAKNIYLTSNITNGHVSITVKDNGIGIPLSDHDKLFSQFFRAKNAENIQGTGLGLNIVKKYLELINGTINFTSKLDEGTTFTIQFPEK